MKLALIFVLLMAGSAFAFTFETPEATTFASIGSTEEIHIPFYSNAQEDITVSVIDSKPWLTQSESILKMEPGVGKIFVLYASPFEGTPTGVPHRFTIVATSLKTGEEQKKFVYVTVNKNDVLDVDRLSVEGNFSPTGIVAINAIIKNFKETTIQNAKVFTKISSPTTELIEFEQPISTIDPGEIHNITYSFTVPKYAEAGLYTVTTTAISGDDVREKARTFAVIRASTFSTEVIKQPGFFGFRKVVTVTNVGNEADDTTVTEKLSPIDAAFYSGEEPLSKSGNEFTWLLRNIKPGEARTFVYYIDFSSVVLLIGIAVIVGWIYFFHLRAMRLKKFILEKKFIELGEEFTVGVEIVNMSGKKVENATVKDFVPSVFEIKDTEGPKPIRKKLPAGTELTWHVKDLHKNEERILTYKIIPMFGIHGTIRLPRASIKYNEGKKETEKRSFYASIGIDMDSYKDKKPKK